LDEFIKKRLDEYKDRRDLPGVDGTSRLSPHLAAGTISPRTCLRAALDAAGWKEGDKLDPRRRDGAFTWISEVLWREFYKYLIAAHPRLSMGKPFKPETDDIEWSYDEDELEAWKTGRTGYPIVDAAMRQLLQTGWMHNRLRMIAAMFLTKDLLIDWRLGERHFMQHLVDGDLASNNGGWQWSASTGTDAAPYFRIFNPESQSKKFDESGDFIRRFIPELRDVEAPDIHNPTSEQRESAGYPEPIVDHAEARERAIEAFKSLSPA
jgi:deoxyribodipyrimidine photo-lyase